MKFQDLQGNTLQVNDIIAFISKDEYQSYDYEGKYKGENVGVDFYYIVDRITEDEVYCKYLTRYDYLEFVIQWEKETEALSKLLKEAEEFNEGILIVDSLDNFNETISDHEHEEYLKYKLNKLSPSARFSYELRVKEARGIY